MEKNLLSFSLKEVADWTRPNSEVEIPALQRGLVWKPRQVEFLWDSLLRGFPIGSFMLSDVSDGQSNAKYYLMDGQQRFNAISIGYRLDNNTNAVLWIDICPPQVKNSTRRFWVKATTDAHPWGFHNNEECSILNTAEKRDALEKYNLKDKSIYNHDFSLFNTWPSCSNKPIPLYYFLNASTVSEDVFFKGIKDSFNHSDFKCKDIFIKYLDDESVYVKTILYPAFKKLLEYRIDCSHLPLEVVDKETNEDGTEQTALEVLFNRINTGGTRISQDDLNYSAIKAYWPNIKNKNDELAAKYMNPSKLAMLTFRLSQLLKNSNGKSNNNKGKWVADLSIKQIRSLSTDENKSEIEELYNGLGTILVIVKK